MSIVGALVVTETKQKEIKCSVCLFNRSSLKFSVTEFLDSPGDQLPMTESLLIQILPIDELVCLVPSRKFENQLNSIISSISQNCQIRFSSPGSVYDTASSVIDTVVESDFRRIMKNFHSIQILQNFEMNKKSFNLLINFFKLNNLVNSCELSEINVDNVYMKLDRASFNALNLFPPPGSATHTSLFGLLNKCRTPMGKRRLDQWIRQPLIDRERIATRHSLVEFFAENQRLRQSIQTQRLARVYDLDSMKFTSIEELIKIYETIISINNLIDDFKNLNNPTINENLSQSLESIVRDMEGFMRLIEECIDLQAVRDRVYQVDGKFDPELGQINQERKQVQNEMDSLVKKVQKLTRVDNIKISECAGPHGLGFRVPRRAMNSIEGVGKFKQIALNKNEYFFTSNELIKLIEKLSELNSNYENKSKIILNKIFTVALSYSNILSSLSEVIGSIDVLIAFAIVAVNWRLVKPVLTDGELSLVKARHLLVEVRAAELSGADFIPNSVRMNRASNIQIITGPNMGGKSTYIRSVALCALMCQIGCFVPCEEAALPVFGSLMCRVGASDAQMRGISTFMQEMIEASCIVSAANENSLVIIDELGRGTSTQEGFGLAWAIARHLKDECRSFVFFATHFHELSKLPEATNRHVAASVTDSGLTLLYEVRDGPTTSSFGTNVAVLAGYPQQVVEAAIRKEQELMEVESI
jgi:DNA mismatch repair protein MSH2